ncbi:MAG: translation initiation factor IF-2 [Spirochaetales bacterium]|nr:translation initiation factor IF-2 [Spirochaetales bacterium]
MGEEQDKTKKPKTTLIKHRKKEPSNTQAENAVKKEKKKVVIIKKKKPKKVSVKVETVQAKASEADHVDETPKEVTRSENKPEIKREERPREKSSQNVQHRDRDRDKEKDRFNKNQSGSFEKKPFVKPGSGGNSYGGNSYGGNNYAGNKGKPGGNWKKDHGNNRVFNKDKDQPERSGPPRTGVNKNRNAKRTDSSSSSSSTAPVEKKQPARKVFYTKKKNVYQKRKEEHTEKFVPSKKKNQKRANPVPKEISIMEVITIAELAKKMNLKASELISKLFGMGMMVTINQQIDAETATILADEFHCKVHIVSLYDETVIEEESEENIEFLDRPPIITVMGHVDHGKTKLLDAIRTANVVSTEFGGITQHIGAYAVDIHNHKIVFLDTPGHEAFTLMRARGAQITDIVVLVVAANDGVMPQTLEAINHAKDAKVPIIVAINKVDLVDANPEKVKKQLSDYNLLPEDWGGTTIFCEISALKQTGITELLDSILLQAEMLELKSNYDCRAHGTVLESKVEVGRGIVSTILVQKGVLKIGDAFIAGIYPGRVRAMFNDKGEKIKEVSPGLPVEVIGLTGIPDSGDPFQVTENEKTARLIGAKRQELKRQEESRNVKKVTLDNLYDKIKEGAIQELKVIIKGDVHGSVEALKSALEKLSTPEIRLTVISALAGAINEGDIYMAAASSAIVIGFHVRPSPNAQAIAEREKVEIRKYNIIYDAIEDIRDAMEGMLSPDLREEVVGTAEVRQTFKVPKIGLIAGCYVTSGKIRRNASAHVIRDGIEMITGKISSLRRFKDDAREVDTGYECGIGIENFTDLKEGDIIEVFEIREIAKKLTRKIDNE